MCDKKLCGNCKKELPAINKYFAERKLKTKTILQWQCRKCQKEYRKNHYEINKDKYIKKASKHKKEVSDWFDEFKKNLTCERCPEDRYWVLDFHHMDKSEKEFNLSDLKFNGSKKKILKEIEKCIVLCSNCHRDLHYQEKLTASMVFNG